MNPLHPMVVKYLLDQMTGEETDELDAYASEGGTPEVYFWRANEWLRRRFPEVVTLEFTVEDSIFRSERSGMN